MSKKHKKLISKAIIFIILIAITVFLYTKYYNIHNNYCCVKLKECKFFTCSSLSTKLREFQIYGLLLCFFGTVTIIQGLDMIKSLFSKK